MLRVSELAETAEPWPARPASCRPTIEEVVMKITVNGLSFNVEVEGEGPAVLLLHGFPDSSALWRHQMPALAQAGFRVIAPDLRGFGASDRPEGVDNYKLEVLVGDVLGVLAALGVDRACVVGHDWGAALGWALAAVAPQQVERLAALSVGHPAGYFTDAIRQREMSWYMLFFLFPGVAEEALPRDDWALFRTWLPHAADMDRYIADLSRPGALTAGLSWYRANLSAESFGQANPMPLPHVACPVLGIWSDGDAYCGEAQMLASSDRVTGPWRYERVEGAGHWIPLDAPKALEKLLLDFCRGE
jgi:pimeloyl-ACP methyl ester carboxylesterase